jgi:hypothetical protein
VNLERRKAAFFHRPLATLTQDAKTAKKARQGFLGPKSAPTRLYSHSLRVLNLERRFAALNAPKAP